MSVAVSLNGVTMDGGHNPFWVKPKKTPNGIRINLGENV